MDWTKRGWVVLGVGIGVAWLVNIGSATAQSFSPGMLVGTYAYSMRGFVNNSTTTGPPFGWVVQNGVITLTKAGTVSGTITSYDTVNNVTCTGTLSGIYSADFSGTGTMSLTFTTSSPNCSNVTGINMSFVGVNGSVIDLIQTTNTGAPTTPEAALSGTLLRQGKQQL
jgi:hypothetical protein